MQKRSEKLKAQKEKERAEKALVAQIEEDFKKRQKDRIKYERQWVLNMNFLAGNQYCGFNARGDIQDSGKEFYWQNREVYNHIAPIIDTRLAKFSSVSPAVSVRPKSDNDEDVAGASLAEKLIAESFKKCDFTAVSKRVTAWSETCGTGFYKVIWNEKSGNKVGEIDGKEIFEGDATVISVSPFEIFPDSLYCQDIEDCSSIIHAKAVSASVINQKYGVSLVGKKIGVYNLNQMGASMAGEQETLEDAVVVIERYDKPSLEFPLGRLITVAGGQLLYNGDLPYINAENGKRSFPFVKQNSFTTAGCFFGTSVIERLIPVQRAYNAVKNRKHEFLNRLSMGVMTVEDGSVDVDDLAEEGLSPGKVLVYRQGSKAPEIMADMTMPDDFNQEESKLMNEFVVVSGVSDVSSSSTNAGLTSGSALEILVEQDNSRLFLTAEEIRRCYVEVAKQTIRLYAQFSAGVRSVKGVDRFNKTKVYYADAKTVGADDVYLENENELLYTNRQKKDMIFKLYESGLLTDDQGNLRPATKEKILSLLGYKDLDYQKGLARLHEEKAQRENEKLINKKVEIDIIDNDDIHIDEHVRYMLYEYEELTPNKKENFNAHILAHEQQLKAKKGEKNGN
ncbi:MAG: hypothetical protein J6U92_06805 [Clostridia bacterium]|nr:hypothetical protein [Clostridia bacterium]